LFVGSWLTRFANPYPSKLIAFWTFAVIFVVLARLAARAVCRRRPAFVQNALVLGSSDAAQLLARKFRSRPDYGVNLVGYVDRKPDDRPVGSVDYLGSVAGLLELVDRYNVERVVVEFPDLPRAQIATVVRDLRRRDVQVDIVPRLYELIAPAADIHTVEGLPLIGLPPVRAERTLRAVKRTVDVLASTAALLLLAPVLGWIALRIKLESPGPVFYRHDRVGEGGRPFALIKFRTMYIEDCVGDDYGGAAAASEFLRLLEDPIRRREFEESQKIVDDPRVTRFGRFLRRLSLDELPQLVNVLLGQMSLVGPRPVTRAELDRYEPDADTLVTFRPGVTGYWQINGRSDTAWEDRVRLDLSYIHGWSLKLDFLILGKTFWVLLTGRGAY
ncbi:MAG: sugar transferase, partial [Gaiellaceae bacterium]